MKTLKEAKFPNAVYDDNYEILYCTCGENDTPEEDQTCKHCGKKAEVIPKISGAYILDKWEITDHSDEWHLRDRNLLRLILHFHHYRRGSRGVYLDKEERETELRFDKDAGELIIVKGFTYGKMYNGDLYWGDMLCLDPITEHAREQLTLFLEECFKIRGIKYRHAKDYVAKDKEIIKAAILLKYPILQHFPFDNFLMIPEESREKLSIANNISDVWRALTNHGSDSIRSFVKSEDTFSQLCEWRNVFKEPSNMLKFLEGFTPVKSKGIYYIFTRDANWSRDNDHGNFLSGMELLVNTVENETVLVRKILKVSDDARINNEVAQLKMFIRDIYNMYMFIKKRKPAYELDVRGDILKIHHVLCIHHDQLLEENLPIGYTDWEKAYEKTIDGLTFELAPDTHSLVTVGSLLDNCLGGYRDEALLKKTNIVFVKEKHEIVIAIEVQNGDIKQVKETSNRVPSVERAKKIIKWAKDCHLSYLSCPDLLASKIKKQ